MDTIARTVITGVLMLMCAHALADCQALDGTHAKWNAIVEEYVTAGQLDYHALKTTDRAALNDYLDDLSSTCAADYVAASGDDKIAFWINAYNAFTVALILEHYPISSIRRIGWLPGAAFRDAFIPMPNLKGDNISLNDIEHGTLRSAFEEPRIHFALVCAARSCPPLRAEAYTGARLDLQLDAQTREFLGDTSKNRYDAARNELELSAIFDWYDEDFEAAAGSVAAYVAGYLELSGEELPRVKYLDYDWRLNDRARQNDGAH